MTASFAKRQTHTGKVIGIGNKQWTMLELLGFKHLPIFFCLSKTVKRIYYQCMFGLFISSNNKIAVLGFCCWHLYEFWSTSFISGYEVHPSIHLAYGVCWSLFQCIYAGWETGRGIDFFFLMRNLALHSHTHHIASLSNVLQYLQSVFAFDLKQNFDCHKK